MNGKKKSMEETEDHKENIEAFTVIKAENASELYTDNHVPIYNIQMPSTNTLIVRTIEA